MAEVSARGKKIGRYTNQDTRDVTLASLFGKIMKTGNSFNACRTILKNQLECRYMYTVRIFKLNNKRSSLKRCKALVKLYRIKCNWTCARNGISQVTYQYFLNLQAIIIREPPLLEIFSEEIRGNNYFSPIACTYFYPVWDWQYFFCSALGYTFTHD